MHELIEHTQQSRSVEDRLAMLEAVIEQIPEGLVIVDAAARPIRANPEALRIFGASSLDDPRLVAWRALDAYSADGKQMRNEDWPLARALRGQTVKEERVEFSGPAPVVLEISTAPMFGPDGAITGALGLYRDVTTRERTERAERDFVTNAAHELQSPLAAILSAIEVLQAGAKEEEPQRDVFLAHIEREANRLARLARALLVLARTQIGLEAPRDELVALRPLLDHIAKGLRLASDVHLEVECREELAAVTNRELVEEAIVNLAENAAKQTQTGRIVLSAEAVAGAIEIAVSDTGPGIPVGERPRIFERFYRADQTRSGFGLGLSIVRSAAEALHGEVEVDSKVGAGTTMRLTIPNAARLVDQ